MADGDIWSVQVQTYTSENEMFNTFYYTEEDGPIESGSNAAAITGQFLAVVEASWRDAVCDACFLGGVYARRVQPTVENADWKEFGSEIGTRNGPALPGSAAAVIRVISTLDEPRHNGRFFLGGIGVPDVADSRLTESYRAGPLNDLLDALGKPLSTVTAGNYTPVTVQRQQDNAPLPSWITRPVIQFVPNAPLGTQIRRKTDFRGTYVPTPS